jgi:hypothetical protein
MIDHCSLLYYQYQYSVMANLERRRPCHRQPAMKVATRIIEHNKQVPKNKRKLIVDIVAETNQL